MTRTYRRTIVLTDRDHGLGHRRRCSWCGVMLRWWQINLCRLCRPAALSVDGVGPPCGQATRWSAIPDGMKGADR